MTNRHTRRMGRQTHWKNCCLLLWQMNMETATQCLFHINWNFPMSFSSLSLTRRTCNELIWSLISAIGPSLGMIPAYELECYMHVVRVWDVYHWSKCLFKQYSNKRISIFKLRNADSGTHSNVEMNKMQKGNDERNVHPCVVVPCVAVVHDFRSQEKFNFVLKFT